MPYCLPCKLSIDLANVEKFDEVPVERKIQRYYKQREDEPERRAGKLAESRMTFVKFSCPQCGRQVTAPKPKSISKPTEE